MMNCLRPLQWRVFVFGGREGEGGGASSGDWGGMASEVEDGICHTFTGSIASVGGRLGKKRNDGATFYAPSRAKMKKKKKEAALGEVGQEYCCALL